MVCGHDSTTSLKFAAFLAVPFLTAFIERMHHPAHPSRMHPECPAGVDCADRAHHALAPSHRQHRRTELKTPDPGAPALRRPAAAADGTILLRGRIHRPGRPLIALDRRAGESVPSSQGRGGCGAACHFSVYKTPAGPEYQRHLVPARLASIYSESRGAVLPENRFRPNRTEFKMATRPAGRRFRAWVCDVTAAERPLRPDMAPHMGGGGLRYSRGSHPRHVSANMTTKR